MDDATPISTLDAAIDKLDRQGGFTSVTHRGREIILMSAEKFEEWEDAVDLAAINASIANPDPYSISLEDLRAKYKIPQSGS